MPRDAGAIASEVDIDHHPAVSPSALQRGFRSYDGTVPPPRPWAYSPILMHKAVTALAAGPGVGKTTQAVRIGINFALGRDFGPWHARATGPVMMLCGEEDSDELDRRILAVCIDEGIDPAALMGRFMRRSTLDSKSVNFASPNHRSDGYSRNDDHIDSLKAEITAVGAKLLIIDPLIEFHSCDETNEGLKHVGTIIREIAVDCGCAVLLNHHTPKGSNSDNAAGDLNSLRGGGSLAGVARFVLTMFSMSEKDAEAYGIEPSRRHLYVRVDGAKANMTLLEPRPVWFERVSIGIRNSTPTEWADDVGVLRYAPLSAADRTTKKAEQTDATLERLGAEIIRVCDLNGVHTSETAMALDPLCAALNLAVVGIKKSAAKGRLIGDFGADRYIARRRIVVCSQPYGSNIVRRVYVEPARETGPG